MIGHKAVVSTLAVSNQVLYSGSWDGTIRLWSLNDHTPLAVLGEEAPCGSVLSLAADAHTLVAAHENGCIKVSNNILTHLSISTDYGLVLSTEVTFGFIICLKMWNNDVPLNSVSRNTSSIFSIYMEGQWIFSGGWDKTVVLQVRVHLHDTYT